MVRTTQVLLLIYFAIQSSLTDDSVKLCSNKTVNYYNNDTVNSNSNNTLVENCGCEKCIRKCCQIGFSYHHERNSADGQLIGECKKDDDSIEFSIPIYDKDKVVQHLREGFKTDLINCTNEIATKWYPECSEPTIYIQRDGSFYFTGYNAIAHLAKYCVDAKDGIPTYYYCSTEDLEGLRAFIQAVEVVPIPFLLLTFLIYAILPEWNTHRKALMAHTFVSMSGYLLLLITNLYNIKDNTACLIAGYLVMYLIFTSEFFINVMCIDIWLAFGGVKELQRKLSKSSLFIGYCVYGFGLNALCLLVVVIYRAATGTGKYCPFETTNACYQRAYSFLYNFLTTTILCVFNTVLYILTTINIRRTKKETAMLKHADSARHANENEEKYTIYWNLLCLMFFNPLSNYLYLFQEIFSKVEWLNGKVYISLATVVTGFYGPLVFIVFVCKKRIWNELMDRYYQVTGKPKPKPKPKPKSKPSASALSSKESNTSVSTVSTQCSTENSAPNVAMTTEP